MNIVLDGKALAEKIKADIAVEAKKLIKKPGLAVIVVGDNPASDIYVRNKNKDCEDCGFYVETYRLKHKELKTVRKGEPHALFPAIQYSEDRTFYTPDSVDWFDLSNIINELNDSPRIDGILLQLPLPEAFRSYEKDLLSKIIPEKDVDGFHPINRGKMLTGEECFLPCTPAGIIALLDSYEIDCAGKRCVVIGRSNIVGKPIAMMMQQKNATVIMCHSKTPSADLKDHLRSADIIITAASQPGLITPDLVKEGVIIIDVSMNRDENGKLCGDCTKDTYEKASYYTPVPGGVGPMTRAMLMKNTLIAAQNNEINKEKTLLTAVYGVNKSL